MKTALFLLLLCLAQPPLQAETLTAVADPWPPYVTDLAPHQGMATRILREALAREGYGLDVRLMPWARSLRRVKSGGADLLITAWWSNERTGFLHYSEPYAQNELVFLKRRDDPFEFSDLTSLEGKRIGVVRDYGYDRDFLQADYFQRIPNNEFTDSVRMLIAGRLDLVLEDRLVVLATLQQEAPHELEKLSFSRKPLLTKPLYVAASLSHPRHRQIIAAVNRGLAAMRNDGTLDRLLNPQLP